MPVDVVGAPEVSVMARRNGGGPPGGEPNSSELGIFFSDIMRTVEFLRVAIAAASARHAVDRRRVACAGALGSN